MLLQLNPFPLKPSEQEHSNDPIVSEQEAEDTNFNLMPKFYNNYIIYAKKLVT